jgi:hypothetical protein
MPDSRIFDNKPGGSVLLKILRWEPHFFHFSNRPRHSVMQLWELNGGCAQAGLPYWTAINDCTGEVMEPIVTLTGQFPAGVQSKR